MQSCRRLVWAWLAVIAIATTLTYAQEPGADSGDPPKLRRADKGDAKPETPSGETKKPEGSEEKKEDKKDDSSDKKPGGLFGGSSFLFIMIGGFLLLYFLMSRGKRKQAAKRKEMLSNLKKGDKMTTIGGIVGTVMEVREDEVTVKVDETNNIRVKFARWAVRGVGETAKTEGPEDKK